MHLSVGHATLETKVQKIGQNIIFTDTISDIYDFDKVDIKGIVPFINNVAYELQKNNLIEPYHWDVTFSFFINSLI